MSDLLLIDLPRMTYWQNQLEAVLCCMLDVLLKACWTGDPAKLQSVDVGSKPMTAMRVFGLLALLRLRVPVLQVSAEQPDHTCVTM